MINWADRARAHFSSAAPRATAKTDETDLSAVLAVRPQDHSGNCEALSSVSSVPPATSFTKWSEDPDFSTKPGNCTAETDETIEALIAAAMRACDHHDDGPAAREQMRRDCLATPHQLRADLLAHFQRAYVGRVQ